MTTRRVPTRSPPMAHSPRRPWPCHPEEQLPPPAGQAGQEGTFYAVRSVTWGGARMERPVVSRGGQRVRQTDRITSLILKTLIALYTFQLRYYSN